MELNYTTLQDKFLVDYRVCDGRVEILWQSINDDTIFTSVLDKDCLVDLDVCGVYFCSGYKQDGIYLACASKSTVSGPGKLCSECAKIGGIHISPFVSSYPCRWAEKWKMAREAERYCVYLARFGSEVLKVGMCVSSRFSLRAREQGAVAAMKIFEGDPIRCRELEVEITRSGISDRVQAATKYRSLMHHHRNGCHGGVVKLLHNDLAAVQDTFEEVYEMEVLDYEAEFFALFTSFPTCFVPNILAYGRVSGYLAGSWGPFLDILSESNNVLLNIWSLKGALVGPSEPNQPSLF
ncbi:MAG: DUF2797 domain-containing protein [Chthonomonas sp.]|nr:DUF2797 domain-containing protein [Chthonomonas sp.]